MAVVVVRVETAALVAQQVLVRQVTTVLAEMVVWVERLVLQVMVVTVLLVMH